MKTKLISGAFLIMLVILIAGTAGAVSGGPETVKPGAGITPLSSTLDAKKTMSFWSRGSSAYIPDQFVSVTIAKGRGTSSVTTAPYTFGDNGIFSTPLALPAKIDGQPTSVRYVYLNWDGDPGCTLTHLDLYSGTSTIASQNVSYTGTGTTQLVTIDLTTWYPVPGGLDIDWTITNIAGEYRHNVIHSYGAKIRYTG